MLLEKSFSISLLKSLLSLSTRPSSNISQVLKQNLPNVTFFVSSYNDIKAGGLGLIEVASSSVKRNERLLTKILSVSIISISPARSVLSAKSV